ncbi:MAG: hypothetical protein R3211_00865 [Balneolaceae bacterium]|nr:hypothetical protein [Balneolaceae bacterium]
MTFKFESIDRVSLFLCVFLIATVPAVAQSNTEADTTGEEQKMVDDILKDMQKEEQQRATVFDSLIVPPSPLEQQLDDSTLEIYNKALYAYYEYRVSGFQHRKKVFAWQLFSTKLIFWSVLLLVFSGITFSGIQFYKSMRMDRSGDTSDLDESITEFEASAKGIKVSSPVLGVIILVISLAFFYLYLIYVYPISDIF